MITRNTYYFLVIVLFLMNVQAQNNKHSVTGVSTSKDSYIMTDFSYSSDAVFMGRRDSITAPYLFPSIGYYDKSGLFIDASASYLIASNENRIDLFLISAGYLFSSNNWSGGIRASGYFFDEDSYNVQSEMTTAVSALLGYNFKGFDVSLLAGGFFNSGDTADIFGELELGRSFYADEKRLVIEPSVTIGAGTQNFYQIYYQSNRLGNRKGNGNGGQNQTADSSISITEATQFNILNIEFGIPFQYYYKSYIFNFKPAVAFPQSKATITFDDGVIKEDLKSVFYWSAGISYWFLTKKPSQ